MQAVDSKHLSRCWNKAIALSWRAVCLRFLAVVCVLLSA